MNSFEIYKTVKLGVPELKTPEDFRRVFVERGHSLSDIEWPIPFVHDVYGNLVLKIAQEPTEVDLVMIRRPEEIGFKSYVFVSEEEIYIRVQELGLQLCPAEVGPQLFLQGSGLPQGEHLNIGMKSVLCHGATFSVFQIHHWPKHGLKFASSYMSNPADLFCSPQGCQFSYIFVKPRK